MRFHIVVPYLVAAAAVAALAYNVWHPSTNKPLVRSVPAPVAFTPEDPDNKLTANQIDLIQVVHKHFGPVMAERARKQALNDTLNWTYFCPTYRQAITLDTLRFQKRFDLADTVGCVPWPNIFDAVADDPKPINFTVVSVRLYMPTDNTGLHMEWRHFYAWQNEFGPYQEEIRKNNYGDSK